MPLVTVNSLEDFEKLKKLASQRQELFKQNIENKIEKQTFDEELAEQYAPITNATQDVIESQKDSQKELIKAIDDQSADQRAQSIALQQAIKDNSVATTTVKKRKSKKQKSITIDQDIITELSPLLHSNNEALLLQQIQGNEFQFGEARITLKGKEMIFEDGYVVPLSKNIRKVLNSNKNDLSSLNNTELENLYNILSRIKYQPHSNPDRKSNRSKAIKQLFAKVSQIQQQKQYQSDDDYGDQDDDTEGYEDETYASGFSHTFLSSDPNELVERLQILIGEQKAGNDNIQDEATAILDELLRQKEIDKTEYKSILNQFLM